jgi:hypothetical protein
LKPDAPFVDLPREAIRPESLPFPESLCHQCAAPPRYVTTDRGSVFVYCPVLKKYPRLPLLACRSFVPVAP